MPALLREATPDDETDEHSAAHNCNGSHPSGEQAARNAANSPDIPEDKSRDDVPSDPIHPHVDDGATPSAVRVLQARSRLAQALKTIPPFRNILIIEDEARDSDRLASTLRTMFGYEIAIRQCRTLGTALDAVVTEMPDLVFLDDRLGPIDRAEKSVPFLRSAKCTATIIVVSSYVDRRRRADLIRLGAGDVIDKDELDSTMISKALVGANRSEV